MNKNLIKQILIVLGTVALFLVLSYGFMPEVLSGKIVNQADISSWHGMTREVVTHNKANPEDPTLWTNSMFGGMPTAAMYDDFDGDWTQTIYKTLLAGKRPAWRFLDDVVIGSQLDSCNSRRNCRCLLFLQLSDHSGWT